MPSGPYCGLKPFPVCFKLQYMHVTRLSLKTQMKLNLIKLCLKFWKSVLARDYKPAIAQTGQKHHHTYLYK